MKLDRNMNEGGFGKYALLRLRRLSKFESNETFNRFTPDIERALRVLEDAGILDWGSELGAEFFVIRLKDKYAAAALDAYAVAAEADDPEYAAEIREMASRAGPRSPFCKQPD